MDATTSKRLEWQHAIDQYTDYLVEEAAHTISDSRMAQMQRTVRLNQFSNLLAVALATDSVNAIVNWVYYQMGRRETRQAWKQTGLGDDIINRINRMRGNAAEAAQRVYGEEATNDQIRAIHVAMVRLYVGYLRRWFVAKGGQN
jgi:hypothetical protein